MAERSVLPTPDLLARLFRRLLRPLVRLLIQSGVTFPICADMLSGLYVDVASRDLLTDPKSRTDSRISLMTGIHRKELRRLRGLANAGQGVLEPGAGVGYSGQAQAPPAVTLGAALVARWLTPPWSDEDGRPKPLPRTAPATEPSFDALVATATRDVRPRTVYDEWLSLGIIALDAGDRAVLNEDAFIPQPGREEQLYYFARNLHDHAAAAVANVTSVSTAPFLDRSVHYDGLSSEAAVRLESIARAAATRMLVQVNREALRLAEADGPQTEQTHRVNLGVYLFAETDGETSAPARGQQGG